MDRIQAQHLRKGHRIRLTTPLPNAPGQEFGRVKEVVKVDEGLYVGVYRIYFERSAFSLAANGDREFEVESSQPEPLPHLLG